MLLCSGYDDYTSWINGKSRRERPSPSEALRLTRNPGECGISKLILVGVLLVSMLGGLRETTALEVGEKAPDFTLPSTMGGQISLRQFQGKQFVLIEFYGADFAPT